MNYLVLGIAENVKTSYLCSRKNNLAHEKEQDDYYGGDDCLGDDAQ